jgi:hypothetical protein
MEVHCKSCGDLRYRDLLLKIHEETGKGHNIFKKNPVASKHEMKMITGLIEKNGYDPDRYVSYFLNEGAKMQMKNIRKNIEGL